MVRSVNKLVLVAAINIVMKKIGIFFLFCSTIFVGLFSWNNKDKAMSDVRISWYAGSKIETHDPADIQFAAPAVLLMNLYTSLLVFNNKSEIDLGLIKAFNWVSDSEIEFVFNANLRSSKNDLITAKDAYLSFKRLMVKQTNTHGDLQNFLCPGIKLNNIKDECPGLRYKENSLFLKATDPKLAKFLIPLIANCDFGIIPANAIDWLSSDLKIIDYANTSGPYFVEATNDKGEHVLRANKNSPLYHSEMPQKVQIIPVLDASSPTKLTIGEIDMISTIDRTQPDDVLALEQNSEYNVHKTSDLKVTAMEFTSVGQEKLTEKERLALGSLIKRVTINSWPSQTALKKADQFFPPFGEASLSGIQLQEIQKLYENSGSVPSKKIRISVESFKLEFYKNLFEDYKNIEFIKFNGMPNSKKDEDMEDALIVPGDTGFYENISLISYYMNTGSFGYNDKKIANDWIQNYIKIDDKSERLAKLKQLHFEVLAKGIIVPISITPYYAVARKDWKLDFHRHFAGTPLWMMRKN